MTTLEEVVRATSISHTYPDGTTVAYRGIPFVVYRGERVALLGPNGSGKTTLLYLLLGLLHPTTGSVRVFGVDPAQQFEAIRRRIGVLLQNPDEQIVAPMVRDDIAYAPRNYGLPEAEISRLVADVSRDLEVDHLLGRVPHYLSGGERRKVALAGALVLRPDLLILDEPFEGLDTVAKGELVALLDRLHDERDVSIVTTTHEINLVPGFADTVYLLARGGSIVYRGSPRQVFSQPDLLRQYHLEPPPLTSLFQHLRDRGIPVDLPLTTDEAVQAIEQLLAQRSVA